MGEQRARPGRGNSPARGRHFLSRSTAADLARRFELSPDDHVVEIGAGSGRLTGALAEHAGLVLAIEADPRLAEGLLRRSARWPNVSVHLGDALRASMPAYPYRAVGNIPFGITTPLLRRFVDDEHVERLDLIVQLAPAIKRSAGRGSVLSVVWATRWEMSLEAQLPARAFHPTPSVDAAWLSARRRAQPLIAPSEGADFEAFVRRGFLRPTLPLARALGLPRSVVRDANVTELRPVDLPVQAWVRLWLASTGSRS